MTPVSPSETIAKAMEGVTPGLWYVCEFKRPNAYHVRSDRRHWSIASAMETEGCSTPNKDVPDAEARANAAYIAACNPVAMREVLALARHAEALQRENAELRLGLNEIATDEEYRDLSAEEAKDVAKATLRRARTLIQGEKQ